MASGSLHRKRLSDLLSPLLTQELKAVYVEAPAGYGKTTLLVQWLQAQTSPHLWYSFDRGDTGDCLARHLLTALEGQDEGGLDRVLEFLRSSGQERLLFLDDYHLHSEQKVHDFVSELVQRTPPRVKLVLASRNPLPKKLTHLYPRRDFRVYSRDCLAFTLAESTQTLRETQAELSDEDCQLVHDRTEGWPAAVQLLSKNQSLATGPWVSSAPCTRSELWNYIAHEVFVTQSKDTQSCFLKLSLLDRFNWSMAADLGVLAQSVNLRAWGAFLVEFAPSCQGWLRFHHLLGQFLRLLAEQRISESERRDFQIRASYWLEERGLFEEAVTQSLSARAWDRAQELLTSENALRRILSHYHDARRWLELLPVNRIENCWILCTHLGVVYAALTRVREAQSFFQKALEDKDCLEAYLCRAGLSFCLSAMGREAEAAQTLENLGEPEGSDAGRSIAGYLLASVQAYQGNALQAQILLQDIDFDGLPVLFNFGVLLQSHVRYQRGFLDPALSSAQKYLKRATVPPEAKAQTLLLNSPATAWGFRARCFHQLGLNEKSEECWAQFNELKERFGVPFFLARLVSARVRQLLWNNRLEEARSYLNSHQDTGQRLYDSILCGAQAELLLREGRAERAGKLLQEWMRGFDVEKNYFHYHQPLVLARARWVLVTRDNKAVKETLHSLDTLLTRALEQGRTSDALEIELLTTDLYLVLGQDEKAQESAERALGLGRPLGFVNIFLSQTPASELCCRLDPSLTRYQSQEAPHFGLEQQELQILALVSEGLSNQEIADRLFLSLHTIKWHNRKIFKKLKVKSRTQATLVFQQYFG